MQIITMSPQDVTELVQSVIASTIQSFKSEFTLVPEKQATNTDQNFSISELAAYLKCSKVTIHAYKNRRVFNYYQTGKTVYFKKSEVDAALASNRKGLKHAWFKFKTF